MFLVLLPCPNTLNANVFLKSINVVKLRYIEHSSYDKSYVCDSTFMYSMPLSNSLCLELSRQNVLTINTCIIQRVTDKKSLEHKTQKRLESKVDPKRI